MKNEIGGVGFSDDDLKRQGAVPELRIQLKIP